MGTEPEFSWVPVTLGLGAHVTGWAFAVNSPSDLKKRKRPNMANPKSVAAALSSRTIIPLDWHTGLVLLCLKGLYLSLWLIEVVGFEQRLERIWNRSPHCSRNSVN